MRPRVLIVGGGPAGAACRIRLAQRGADVADRVILVGENLDCTYDFSGEGIGKALESGILAAEAIAAADPPYGRSDLIDYERRLVETSDAFHRGYTRVTSVMGHPIGNRFFTQLLTRSHRARRALRSIVREGMLPRELFSARGVLLTLDAGRA